MDANPTERVQQTRRKLRKQTLTAIFDEFDGKLMGLDRRKRAEKYRKMAESPFSFFRGSTYLFYSDVTREWFPYHTRPERPTWIQGDLHFENFGAFRSESGVLVYDVNDFDEGYLGSYLYDLLRMSVSIALVCRVKMMTPGAQQETITAFLKGYAQQIRRFAKRKDDPETFVMDEDRAEGQIRKLLKKLRKRKEQHFLEKVTAFVQQKRQFTETDEIVPLTEEERNALVEAWPQYLASVEAKGEDAVHYVIKDMAVKHGSGTASIGLDRYYVLIEAGGAAEGIDDVVLEVKEVRVPVPAYFLPYDDSFWSAHGHQGKRVVMTQKAMHHEADPFLGCLSIGERHFYVRERSPYKKRLKLAKLETADALETVVDCMGRLTAKLHARADVDVRQGILDYHSEDEIVLAMGDDEEAFCATITQWALAYAGQVERDYEIFVEWAGSRRKS